jgi:hypothetical protein
MQRAPTPPEPRSQRIAGTSCRHSVDDRRNAAWGRDKQARRGRPETCALDDDRGCRLASADARFGWTKRKHDLAHVRRADVVQGTSLPYGESDRSPSRHYGCDQRFALVRSQRCGSATQASRLPLLSQLSLQSAGGGRRGSASGRGDPADDRAAAGAADMDGGGTLGDGGVGARPAHDDAVG